MRQLITALLLILGLGSVASAQRLSTHELRVQNNASSGIRNIYVRDLEQGTSLGDRLVGKIPSRTSAVIDLITSAGSCRMKLTAVLYDERSTSRTMNVCQMGTWTIHDSGELDD